MMCPYGSFLIIFIVIRIFSLSSLFQEWLSTVHLQYLQAISIGTTTFKIHYNAYVHI